MCVGPASAWADLSLPHGTALKYSYKRVGGAWTAAGETTHNQLRSGDLSDTVNAAHRSVSIYFPRLYIWGSNNESWCLQRSWFRDWLVAVKIR